MTARHATVINFVRILTVCLGQTRPGDKVLLQLKRVLIVKLIRRLMPDLFRLSFS